MKKDLQAFSIQTLALGVLGTFFLLLLCWTVQVQVSQAGEEAWKAANNPPRVAKAAPSDFQGALARTKKIDRTVPNSTETDLRPGVESLKRTTTNRVDNSNSSYHSDSQRNPRVFWKVSQQAWWKY